MIKIDDYVIDASASVSDDGNMSFEYETTDSLDTIEGILVTGQKILVVENGDLVGKYYNKTLKSMTVTVKSPRKVRVVLEASAMTDTVEKELRGAVDEQGDAIADLAGTVSDMNEDAEISAEAFQELADLVAWLVERNTVLTEDVETLKAANSESNTEEPIRDEMSRVEDQETEGE